MSDRNVDFFSSSRVEAFSDGVFAIIVTLLVLEIKVPHLEMANSSHELVKALAELLPKFISWVISFFTICVIWVNHHRLFSLFRRIDNGIFWINALLLLFVSFIPFPTALLGDYFSNQIAVSMYGLVFGLMAMSFVIMRLHVLKNRSLIEQHEFIAFKTGTKFAFLFGPVPYFIAAALAWVHPLISIIIYIGVPIYFITPHSVAEHQKKED